MWRRKNDKSNKKLNMLVEAQMIDGRIKILQPTDWSFKPMNDYIKSGGEAFSVSRFGYELFESRGVDVDWVSPNYNSSIVRLLAKFFKLEGCNLVLQWTIIRLCKNYDVIYYSADRHPYLLALAKKLKICKKPVLMVCHFSYDLSTVDSKLKKLILAIERKLVYSSMDKILFNCETLMNLATENGKLPQRHRNNSGWGADLNFFKRGEYGVYKGIQPFYFAAGGANRDYHTLIEAFRKLPYKLVLSCPRSVIEEESPLPDNIIHFDYCGYGFERYDMLRSYFHDCRAVLIPVKYRNHVANGASVFVEALACGKPIIVTDLKSNFLDVEKENIGLKVKINSAEDWCDKINYIENNLEILEAMGKNSYEIAKNRYNYELFTDNVVKALRELTNI